LDQSPTDTFGLIRRFMPRWSPNLIFDVGAHLGESATELAAQFPKATVHSFEPSPASYRELVKATAGFPNVTTHNMALGRQSATLRMTDRKDSSLNKLLPDDPAAKGAIKVQVQTGAEVLRELNLSKIDFLKIDTEGHDYDVLIGFLPVIQQTDFVQVEASMNPYNTTHIPLRAFEDLLRHLGFHLFHIFEQTMEWKRGGRPVLRRCNPVFINAQLVNLDKIS
jgi:FkbM family methyltransferase